LRAVNVQESEEIYFLSAAADDNVKIRDQVLDIKRLEHVCDRGLEQWRPVLKAPFPISAAAMATARAALGLSESTSAASALSLEELITELTSSDVIVRVVKVRKTRTRYLVEGCVAERTGVRADGKAVRTVAIEDSNAEKVIAAVRSMGLDRFSNISYPRGLKQLLGLAVRDAQS
jgi:exopolyphosphatase/guanosine-5'-triphosphate,3'-diphosphate pyrophosphatase